MPAWLTLMIIVLVSLAFFADFRRTSADEIPDLTGRDELPGTASGALLRPNVRDTSQNGHPASVPRPLPARRAGRDVRKHR